MKGEISQFAAVIGLDWADRKHDVCLFPEGSDVPEPGVIEHDPVVIAAWAEELRRRFLGRPIAVCVELARGPIVSALLEHDIFVVFPVNPGSLAKYRRALHPSRAKDDPTDAFLAADFFRRHTDQFSPLRREHPAMRALQRLVQDRRSMVDDRVRITNRITCALKDYFPQVLQLFRDKETGVFAEFLERWSSLQDVQKVRPQTLIDFFHQNNVRYPKTVQRRVEAIKTATPLTRDPAVIEPARLVVESLLPQLRCLSRSIDRFDQEIEKHCAKLVDFKIFASLPGAGKALAPRLLAAFGTQRDRFPDAASVQKAVGIAPVTEASGNKHWVHWRWICPTFQRQTFVEWVEQTIPLSFWAKTFYLRHRAKGAKHNAAIRALAFKWIRILWRCWVDRAPYDESRYLAALQKRGSPILAFAANNSAVPT